MLVSGWGRTVLALRRAACVVSGLCVLGCSPSGDAAALCDPPRRTGTLPDEIRESSGLAASRRLPGVFWTHDDSGGDALLFAIDSTGALLGSVRVTDARNRDWEALALGPCPSGDCLYIADTGDNQGGRDDVAIYRVPEPRPEDSATAPAERLPIRYPEGHPDTEAIYVLLDGGIHLVTKGRNTPVTVYRYPGEARPEQTVEVVLVGRLTRKPVPLPYQVTGAAASPDGRWVVVRTYTAVQIYQVGRRGRLRPRLAGTGIDVQTLAEPQGEAVAVTEDGAIVLTSEAGPEPVPGTIGWIDCRLE